MKNNLKIFFISNVLLLQSIDHVYGNDYNCERLSDCETLGYAMSESACTEEIKIHCPTDASKVFCNKSSSVKWPQVPLPILYGDGTVSRNILDDKTPIGVVFDETNKLAMALTDIKKDGTYDDVLLYDTEDERFAMSWAGELCDVPELENCNNHLTDETKFDIDKCATNGKKNTAALLVSSCGGTYEAALAVSKYEPAGCTAEFCKKKQWFLPSMRDAFNQGDNFDKLRTTYTLLSGTGVISRLPMYSYWSSVEANERTYGDSPAERNACMFRFDKEESKNLYYFCTYKRSKYFVRPVVYYGESTDDNTGGGSLPTLLEGCPENTTPKTCSGKEYCCPSGASCDGSSAHMCFSKSLDKDVM